MTTPTPRTFEDFFEATYASQYPQSGVPDGIREVALVTWEARERDLAAALESLQSADEDRLRMRAQTARLDAALIEKDISIAARDAELALAKAEAFSMRNAAVAATERAEAAERELAALKAENSKLRSALEIVHFKREPWQ